MSFTVNKYIRNPFLQYIYFNGFLFFFIWFWSYLFAYIVKFIAFENKYLSFIIYSYIKMLILYSHDTIIISIRIWLMLCSKDELYVIKTLKKCGHFLSTFTFLFYYLVNFVKTYDMLPAYFFLLKYFPKNCVGDLFWGKKGKKEFSWFFKILNFLH